MNYTIHENNAFINFGKPIVLRKSLKILRVRRQILLLILSEFQKSSENRLKEDRNSFIHSIRIITEATFGDEPYVLKKYIKWKWKRFIPNGTPNLWLLPNAISHPNSPGGFSMVNASKSVAQHVNAWTKNI